MSKFSLYDRVTKQGTLLEPKGVTQPHHALPSMVHWMLALAMLVEDEAITFNTAKSFYKKVQRKGDFTDQQQNSIFSQLLFSLHQLSALTSLQNVPSAADVVRIGVVAWYYGIYDAARAMLVAKDGELPDNHTAAAGTWDHQLAAHQQVMNPFAYRISTLVKKDAEWELEKLRDGNNHKLRDKPRNAVQAHGAACGYLSGTVIWWRKKEEGRIRASNEFKAGGFQNFLTNPAKDLRDLRLAKKQISFLHQAYRYRGKANYREALFLGYGDRVERNIEDYVENMTKVLHAFVAMAGAYASQRLGPDLWNAFVEDVDARRAFSLSTGEVWT